MYDEANLRGGTAGSRRGRAADLASWVALAANLVTMIALVDLVRDVGKNKQRARRCLRIGDDGDRKTLSPAHHQPRCLGHFALSTDSFCRTRPWSRTASKCAESSLRLPPHLLQLTVPPLGAHRSEGFGTSTNECGRSQDGLALQRKDERGPRQQPQPRLDSQDTAVTLNLTPPFRHSEQNRAESRSQRRSAA